MITPRSLSAYLLFNWPNVLGYIFLGCGLISCTPVFQKTLTSSFKNAETVFQDHRGFALYDLEANKMVYEYKADKYFTPASNIKILTLYACLVILGDSIPALRYIEKDDSLIIWGTGDPTFLNKNVFSSSAAYNFLKNSPKPIYLSTSNFFTERYGPGWGWDDYNGGYQPEKSPLPLYGNVVTATLNENELMIQPARFAAFLSVKESKENATITREEFKNRFIFYPSAKTKAKEFEIPFTTNDSILSILLKDTLHRDITQVENDFNQDKKTIFSVPADSVYKVMMQDSDNFLAEQLLLVCAGVISDSLKPETAIRFVQSTHLADLPDKIKWADGSGLSRYNLSTPRNTIRLWEKINDAMPSPQLFPLLATGGVNGTVKNWYKAETPYIFGKTGTLANNHSLSGYLITKSGKTLIFSFMNSNYLVSHSDIRRNMQNILEYIRDTYK
jgi:serine-type D-Ala-D-Ala carboxypeptidase/endopeptidase (penicillin-binding protein 4)